MIGCDNHTVDERILAKAMRSVMQSIQEVSEHLKTMMMEEIRSIEMENGEEDISAKQEEVAKLKQKKLKAVDLMLEGIITKDDLKKQVEIYDTEIERLSAQIANNTNLSETHKAQLEQIRHYLAELDKAESIDVESFEVYNSMLKKNSRSRLRRDRLLSELYSVRVPSDL